jgi:peroxidase
VFTGMMAYWGHMVSHDICHGDGDPAQAAPMPVPKCDPNFDPGCTGAVKLPFSRTFKTPQGAPRNEYTSWVDLSTVYGHTNEIAARLRTGAFGLMRTSVAPSLRDVLPPDAGPSPVPGQPALFDLGAENNNVQPALQAFNTLFIREHNRYVTELFSADRTLGDEELYQRARARNRALFQKITYEEYLPRVLGSALPPYAGFNATAKGAVTSEFCTVAMRYGHSAQPAIVARALPGVPEAEEGHLILRDHFLNTAAIRSRNVDSLLYGAATYSKELLVSARAVLDMRNFFVGLSRDASTLRYYDIPAADVQRGRDHGLPTFNAARAAMGLKPFASWSEFAKENQAQLAVLYSSIDDVDLLAGAASEVPGFHGSQVGETTYYILRRQFMALRDADRYWYENPQSSAAGKWTSKDTLSRFVLDNTNLKVFPSNPFVQGSKLVGDAAALGALADAGDLLASPDTVPGSLEPGADGTLKAKLADWFELSWRVSPGKSVTFVATVKTRGWVGLGFQAEGRTGMAGADIVIGALDPTTGAGTVADCHATGTMQPARDPSQSLSAASFTYDPAGEGTAVLTFTRPLLASDDKDVTISPVGQTRLIFATGATSMDLASKHPYSGRGSALISLASGASKSEVGKWPAFVWIHVVGMIISWVVLAPIAVISIRYFKTRGSSATVFHKVMMGFVATSLVPLVLLTVVSGIFQRGGNEGRSSLQVFHLSWAWLYVLLIVPQFILGHVIDLSRTKANYAVRFKKLRMSHRNAGRFMLVLVVPQILSGYVLSNMGAGGWIFLGLVAGAVSAAVMFLELRKRGRLQNVPSLSKLLSARANKNKVQYLTDSKAGLQQHHRSSTGSVMDMTDRYTAARSVSGDGGADRAMSREALAAAVASGHLYLVFQGYVLDLSEWVNAHPGGSEVIKNHLGKDLTDLLLRGGPALGGHVHSRPALRKTEKLRIATFLDKSAREVVTERRSLSGGAHSFMPVLQDQDGTRSGASANPSQRERNAWAKASSTWDGPLMSVEEYQLAVLRDGELFVTMDGFVLDLGGYLAEHPGGGQLLQRWIGRDITLAFVDMAKLANVAKASNAAPQGMFSHSGAAYTRAIGLRFARLNVPEEESVGVNARAVGLHSIKDAVELQNSGAGIVRPNPAVSEVPEPVANLVDHLKVTLVARRLDQRETGNAVALLEFECPGNNAIRPAPSPGQHYWFAGYVNGRNMRRQYTPLEVDPVTGKLLLLVSLIPNGAFSGLLSSMPIGSSIEASLARPMGPGIMGLATKSSSPASAFLFMAGGAGLSSFIGFLKSLSIAGSRPAGCPTTAYLVLFERHRGSSLLPALCEEVCAAVNANKACGVRCVFHRVTTRAPPGFTGLQGHASRELLHAVTGTQNMASFTAFVSGSPHFEKSCDDVLAECGIKHVHIMTQM